MYNNFSSKKTKKVISALLASALVVTSAPITADAATTKVLGVNKTFTKTATKVSGLSKSEKKIVKVTVNKSKKKVTVKGLKPGKASFKIGKKSYTFKVGAVKIKAKSFKTSLTVGTNKTVTVTSSYGAKDKLAWSSSNKKVVKVKTATTTASSKKVGTNKLIPVAAGKATITVKSKNTGKSLKVKVTVNAKTTPTTAPTATATGGAVTTPSVEPTATTTATKTPEATTAAAVTATPEVPSGSSTKAPTATPDVTSGAATATPTEVPTAEPTAVPTPATCGAITVTTNATGAAVKVITNGAVVATGTATNGVAVIPAVANGDYTVEVSQTGFKTASKEVTVKGDVATEVTLEVTKEFTATQIGRQSILVTGEDLTDKVADYTLLKGNTSVAVDSIEVSADNKSATLKSASSNLSAGTYTLKFNKSEYTFTVEAEKVSSIELIGENLVLEPNTTTCGSIGFKVLNQFGERTAANVNTTCTLAVNSNVTTIQCTKNADGKIEVKDMVGNIIAGTTTGTIVIVDTETGVNVSKTVTVTAQSAIDSIKVIGLYKNYNNSNKAEKVESLTSDATIGQYAVLVKAYDQYGNEDTDNTLFNKDNVTITATGTTGITVDKEDITNVTIGDETYLAIPLDATSLVDGSTTLTIVGNTKGLLGTASITVTKPVKVASIKLSQSETLYNGTKSEVSYIAKDSKGEDVTDFDTLNALGTSKFTTAGGDGTFQWSRQKDGSAKLYFTPRMTKDNASSDTASQILTVTTQVDTSVDVATFTIYNTKKATAIVGFDSGVALAAITKGGDRKVTLKAEDLRVQDQYGNILTDAEFAGLGSTITIEKDGTNTAFASTYDTKQTKIVTAKDTVVFDLATTATAGKTKFKFALDDVENSDYTVTMQSVDIEDVDDFEIGDFDTLYVEPKAADADTDVAAGDGIDLKVTGKIGGTTVNLTAADYNVIGTAHIEYTSASDEINVKENNGDLNIYEEGSTTKYGSTTETLEVIIKNEAGKSITKKIALSSVAPEANSVAAKDDKFEVSKGNSATIDVSDIVALLEVKNQYNTDYVAGDDEPRVQFTNIPDKFTVADNNTKTANLTIAGDTVTTASKTFTVGVKVTYASGLTFEDTLVVSVLTDAEIAANAAAAKEAAQTALNNATIARPTVSKENSAAVSFTNAYDVTNVTIDTAGEVVVAANNNKGAAAVADISSLTSASTPTILTVTYADKNYTDGSVTRNVQYVAYVTADDKGIAFVEKTTFDAVSTALTDKVFENGTVDYSAKTISYPELAGYTVTAVVGTDNSNILTNATTLSETGSKDDTATVTVTYTNDTYKTITRDVTYTITLTATNGTNVDGATVSAPAA